MGNNFQVIDLVKQTFISGKIETGYNFENVNVHWQQQFLHQNKLYFTDNVHSYGDDLRPIKFGCFDIETKRVDFLQEVPELLTGQFAQVIYHEDKLYLRTSGNELFIYEDEISS